jgi:hypothetical protein
MPSPFPGMDPYLEQPSRWPNVHYSLTAALRDRLQALLRPHYWVALEERVYVSDTSAALGRPDVSVVERQPGPLAAGRAAALLVQAVEVYLPAAETVREPYLTVRSLEPEGRVVTVIEVLSPSNKSAGAGRDAYLEKRGQVLASAAHLVEIDLLREGRRMPFLGAPRALHYGILISRGPERPRAEWFAFTLGDSIPPFPLPLDSDRDEPIVPLQEIVTTVYDRGGFDLVIDYRQAPEPPLSPAEETWAAALLTQQGLR